MNVRSVIQFIGGETRNFILQHLLDEVCDGDRTLVGACAVASYINDRACCIVGIESKMMIGELEHCTHCWTEIVHGNATLCLDVTATQFGKHPRVLLRPRDAYYSLEFMRGMSGAHERAPGCFDGWDNQSPIRYLHLIEDHLQKHKQLFG